MKTLKLIICILIPLTIGSISSLFTISSITDWYTTIIKPSFNLPNYIFGPIWTILYILMGISLYLVIESPKNREKKDAYTYFAIQLVLNFLWSIFFFYFHSPAMAAIDILLLLFVTILMLKSYHTISPLAAKLQIPYLLWVCFATFLNISIWYLNR